MKKKFILISVLILLVYSSFAQIKVTNGQVVVGSDGIPGIANLESKTNTSQLEYALNASQGNPDFTFQVNGNTRGQFKYVVAKDGIDIQVDSDFVGNGGLTGVTRVMHLNNSKNVGIGTNTPTERLHVVGNILATGSVMQGSDRQLKKNIQPLERGLADILNIKTYSFEYNNKAEIENDRLQYGVIAQELKAITPELVGTFVHKIYEDAPDGESSKLVGEEEYLYINTSAIQWMLVKAIQEQQALINQKNQELTDLKNQISTIQAQLDMLLKKQSTTKNQ